MHGIDEDAKTNLPVLAEMVVVQHVVLSPTHL